MASKSRKDVKVVEFVVQDCPICGRKVARHYIEIEEVNHENISRKKDIC